MTKKIKIPYTQKVVEFLSSKGVSFLLIHKEIVVSIENYRKHKNELYGGSPRRMHRAIARRC
jgi:hypothetical protein